VIGLDTNVIVRYVAQDDPTQSAIAAALIDSLSTDAPGFVALISVVELVWVLTSCYRAPKEKIIDVIETLLRSKELIVENADILWQALHLYRREHKADLPDCLIERSADAAGCDHTVTFDRNAAMAAGMRLVVS
jgi:predicted nucleic-acid-binding protein